VTDGKPGGDNPRPVSRTPEYQRNHARVRRERGKASEYQCLLCFDLAAEWAHLWRTHPDPTDIWSYEAMCHQDHRDYDENSGWDNPEIRARRIAARQQINTPEYRAKASERARKRWDDPEFKQRASDAMWEAWKKRRNNARGNDAT
jgi:hypothetical protein